MAYQYEPASSTAGFYDTRLAARAAAVEVYRRDLLRQMDHGLIHLDELRGKDLACHCALDAPCHADVLLELANCCLPVQVAHVQVSLSASLTRLTAELRGWRVDAHLPGGRWLRRDFQADGQMNAAFRAAGICREWGAPLLAEALERNGQRKGRGWVEEQAAQWRAEQRTRLGMTEVQG